jgi:hypothetical protein
MLASASLTLGGGTTELSVTDSSRYGAVIGEHALPSSRMLVNTAHIPKVIQSSGNKETASCAGSIWGHSLN